jgi:hypothetical protein
MPLGGHHKQHFPVRTAQDAREAATIKIDGLQNFAALANAHAMFVADVCVPDSILRIQTDPVRVIAKSNEAKALGLDIGMPYFEIRDMLEKHHVHVFSGNYTLYGDFSRRVAGLADSLRLSVHYEDATLADKRYLSFSHWHPTI